MGRLAILIEKARKLMKRKSKLADYPASELACWQHELLDSVAISIMQTAPQFVDSDVQFIRAVLGGSTEDDTLSFLSKDAVIQVYEEAFRKLVTFVMESPFACIRNFGSLSCSPANFSASESKSSADVTKMAYFSLEILKDSFFTLKSYCNKSELLPGIGSVVFILDWEYIMSRASQTAFNDGPMDNIKARQEFGKAMHAFRTSIGQQFWRNLPTPSRVPIGSRLTQFIRSAIFEQDAFDTGIIVSLCCKWMVEVSELLCVNQSEEQKLIDLLLRSDSLWPVWVIPDSIVSERKPVLKVEHVPTDVHILGNHTFVALVDKLILEIGIHRVIAGSDVCVVAAEESATNELVTYRPNISRAWLAAEMLCTWKWPGGSALDTLLPSLSQYTKSESNGDHINLFDSILNILLEGALMCGGYGQLRFFTMWPPSVNDLDAIEEPFLRALVSLLLTLLNDGIWNQNKVVALSELLINKLYIGQETDMNCLRIIPPVMSVLAQSLPDSFREDIVKDWLEKVLAFSSLISWTSGEDKEEWFQLALSCYPLSSIKDEDQLKLDLSSLEKKILLDLFHKQRLEANKLTITNKLPVVQSLLSRLMVVAVRCCWEEFDEEDWIYVLSHLRCWIELVVTTMEEAAECLDLETGNASCDNLEPTINKLEEIMLNLDMSLINVAMNALYAFSLFVKLVPFHSQDTAEKVTVLEREVCYHTIDQIQEGILRIFLSAGISEAISNLLSCEALSIIARSKHVHPHFWNLVASGVAKSSTLAREQAFKSVQLWGLRNDAISSLMAIVFSSKPVSPLRVASFVLLSSAPFSRWSIMKENALNSLNDGSTFDQGSSDLDSSSESSPPLKEEIHYLIQHLPVEILDLDLESQERVNVFLAWCLVLSYLVSLPSSSSIREKLVQHVQEFASSAILDCLFQHIPLELCVTQGKKKDLELPAELADIATAATRAIRTGSVLFAVESLWPIRPEKMASLSAAIFGLLLRVLPAYVRVWFSDLRDRSASSAIESFTKTWCSPHLVSDELSQIKKSDFVDESFSVSVSKSANEVIATYTKDETGLDLVIRLPSSYPLRPVDVECTKSLGISEVKQRKWLLSMVAFVRNQNGALAEAIRTWKSNFDKEFEGVEECPICYSVIHTTNHSIPRLACRTCKHKFHAACLYKWFSTSHKSTCPLCQSPF